MQEDPKVKVGLVLSINHKRSKSSIRRPLIFFRLPLQSKESLILITLFCCLTLKIFTRPNLELHVKYTVFTCDQWGSLLEQESRIVIIINRVELLSWLDSISLDLKKEHLVIIFPRKWIGISGGICEQSIWKFTQNQLAMHSKSRRKLPKYSALMGLSI